MPAPIKFHDIGVDETIVVNQESRSPVCNHISALAEKEARKCIDLE